MSGPLHPAGTPCFVESGSAELPPPLLLPPPKDRVLQTAGLSLGGHIALT